MTKPNYKTMSRDELRAYVRTHHEDDEAIREYSVHRRPEPVISIDMTGSYEEVMRRLEAGLRIPGAKPEPSEEEES